LLRQRGQSAIKVIDFGSSCYEHQKGISVNILSPLDIHPSSKRNRQLCRGFKVRPRPKPAEHIFMSGFARSLVLKLRQNALINGLFLQFHSSVQKF